jgi:hypothetical protein
LSPIKPKIKPPVKPKIKGLTIPRLNALPKTKNFRNGYLIKIKKGNSVIAFTKDTLPTKRATNFARRYTDNNIGASYSLTLGKKTRIKDIDKLTLSRKFRTKKSKSKKVQLSVEKSKYRQDKKREQSQIAKAKKIKATKKKLKAKPSTKKKKKVKVSTKTKKSFKKKWYMY